MVFIRYSVLTLFVIASVTSTGKQLESQKAALEDYIKRTEPKINQRYRLHYHVAPPVGWMNNPNGFSFYKNEYHIFYQYHPYNSTWGPMHWGHSSSPDLVNWKTLPTALLPEKEQCFSGSAAVDGDKLILMYTAHEITDNSANTVNYNETQYLATSSDGVNFVKYEGNPVLPSAPNSSPDFRHPKIWKHADYWYAVIGSKTDENRGQVLLYRSTDLKSWNYLTVIGESKVGDNLGYMWESPDFFELDGKFILLMSVQGMAPVGDRYKTTFQTGYIIGTFSYDTFKFTPEVGFQEIDYGHDFYATQTLESNGVRYLAAWFGIWETEFPEAKDGWAGALTTMRELKLVGNKVLMKPVQGINFLRDNIVLVGKFNSAQVLTFDMTADITVKGNLSQKIELRIEGRNGGGSASIIWDPSVRKVFVDRGSNDTRQVQWTPIYSHSWRLLLDASSLELFCGEGEVVFSSRVYPDGPWKVTNLSPQQLDIEAYHLKRSVPYYHSSSTQFKPQSGFALLIFVFTVLKGWWVTF